MKIINPYRFTSAGGFIVHDTFTDSDSTAITAHTPDVDTEGGGWSVTAGSGWVISGNRLTSAAVLGMVVIDSGLADCVFSFDLTHGATSSVQREGAVARWVGPGVGNCWSLGVKSASGSDPVLFISEYISTVETARATTTMTGEGPLTGETWTYTVTLSGDDLTIEVTINGTPYSCTYNSSSYNTATTHGLQSRQAPFFDNFELSAL